MNEIKMLETDNIAAHPRQYEIYGETEVSQDFVDSIRERDILQPLLVTDTTLFDNPDDFHLTYTIVAGHRRLKAARELGLYQIPCIIKTYKDEEECMLDLLHSNKNREKTMAQRRAEYLILKQKLRQLGKLKQGKKLTKTEIEDKSLHSFLENIGVDTEKPLDSVAILKNFVGFSEHYQNITTAVYEDVYFEDWIERLKKLGLKEKKENVLRANYLRARTEADKNEKELSCIAAQVVDMLKDAENQLKKKPRKPRASNKMIGYKKPKPAAEPVEFNPKELFDIKKLKKSDDLFGITVKIDDIHDYEFGLLSYAEEGAAGGATHPFITNGKTTWILKWEKIIETIEKMSCK